MRTLCVLSVVLGILSSPGISNAAPVLGVDFAGSYTVTNLGNVPSLPFNYGGLTTLPGDPNTLLIGGQANAEAGRLYTIGLVRDGDNHITGFTGTATAYGDVGNWNDGGVVFGPGGVLFTAGWPTSTIGQTRPGDTDEFRVDTFATENSISALNFVPAGFSGAGKMKVVSYGAGAFYDVTYTPDGFGAYNLSFSSKLLNLTGGPEGFVYVGGANPGFGVNSMLVSEYLAGKVGVYAVDADGNPIVSSRRDFLTGLSGAEGAFIDPLTGDFLFSTFGSGNEVYRVSGFLAPPPPPSDVPEPASLALFGLGTLGAARLTRRRRTGCC